MREIAHLGGGSNSIRLAYMDRVFTPRPAMELGVQLHLSRLSMGNTVMNLDTFGIDRCRSTVHNGVQKVDLEPRVGRQLEKSALDENVIKIGGERFWFVAAADPDTNRFPHVGLYSHRTTVETEMVLRALQEKHDVDDAEFFVDSALWLHAGLPESGCACGTKPTVIGTQSKVRFKR